MRHVLTGSLGRLVTVLLFLGGSLAILLYLSTGAGVRIPLISGKEYTAVAVFKDIDNLVTASRVQIAGVQVGQVREVTRQADGMRVKFSVDDKAAPLHEGVAVRLGERSLVGEGYLDVTDGKGKELRSGATIPEDGVKPSVQLGDILASLDTDTRDELGSLVRSLGQGTDGPQQDVSGILDGLGDLGREGHTALDAIASQSEDLKALAQETSTVLRALDTGQGQIATLVSNVDQLTQATAGQQQAIEDVLRQAPGVLDSAKTASGTLTKLSGALAPVAADLKTASPLLTDALEQLPATSADLHGLLPPLSGTLDLAPDTLNRVPTLGTDVRNVIPPVRTALRDVNPMLAFIKPYGPELSAFFANFNAIMQYTDESGAHYVRLTPLVNTYSVQTPVPYEVLTYTNPYPAPGTGAKPGPFSGPYPRVERDPE
ncbi:MULTISPECIES: MlaD family protein [Protofrankia]|uniref:Mammalian cell entry related domain protein n=1 Tax=Candidatus Protofrankia datiscae TaxID=2716812 RepID=F8AY54_9ACTN|nr:MULTISPECIES: MlaD family protein [Protofrankia]AEH09484.1 Mammalian cell entry related domain protein [Candidatus Protofrankia datiscae]